MALLTKNYIYIFQLYIDKNDKNKTKITQLAKFNSKHSKNINFIKNESNNNQLVIIDESGYVKLWDLSKPLKYPLNKYLENEKIKDVKYSDDGQYLSILDTKGNLKFLPINPSVSQQENYTLPPNEDKCDKYFNFVEFLPLVKFGTNEIIPQIATIGKSGKLCIWEYVSNKHDDRNKYLNTIGQESELKFNPVNPNEYIIQTKINDNFYKVEQWIKSSKDKSFEFEGKNIIYSKNGYLGMIDKNNEPIFIFANKQYAPSISKVNLLSFGNKFTPDNNILNVALARDTKLEIWELKDNNLGDKPRIFEINKLPMKTIKQMKFSFDDTYLVLTGGNGTVCILLNIENPQCNNDTTITDSMIKQIDFSPDGQVIFTLGEDNVLKILDLKGKELYKLSNVNNFILNPQKPNDQIYVQLVICNKDQTCYIESIRK